MITKKKVRTVRLTDAQHEKGMDKLRKKKKGYKERGFFPYPDYYSLGFDPFMAEMFIGFTKDSIFEKEVEGMLERRFRKKKSEKVLPTDEVGSGLKPTQTPTTGN